MEYVKGSRRPTGGKGLMGNLYRAQAMITLAGPLKSSSKNSEERTNPTSFDRPSLYGSHATVSYQGKSVPVARRCRLYTTLQKPLINCTARKASQVIISISILPYINPESTLPGLDHCMIMAIYISSNCTICRSRAYVKLGISRLREARALPCQ
jgi:hypothetical protein